MRFFLAFAFIFLTSLQIVLASACCSSGSALPALITGDDQFQLSNSFSSSFVVAEVDSDGESYFYDDPTNETLYGVNLSSAVMFPHRLQAGAQVPFQWRTLGERSDEGVGDIKLNFAFEAFPLYSYSAWRPQVFIFTAIKFPTGKSTYESDEPRLDTFGKGFYTPSLGFLTIKSWRKWDLSLSGEWGAPLARQFNSESIDPGFTYSALISGGYHVTDFRLGLSLGPNYEEPSKLKRANVRSKAKLAWDTSVSFSYVQNDFWSYSISYLDQTLFGPAQNTKLNRSFSVAMTYRIPQ